MQDTAARDREIERTWPRVASRAPQSAGMQRESRARDRTEQQIRQQRSCRRQESNKILQLSYSRHRKDQSISRYMPLRTRHSHSDIDSYTSRVTTRSVADRFALSSNALAERYGTRSASDTKIAYSSLSWSDCCTLRFYSARRSAGCSL